MVFGESACLERCPYFRVEEFHHIPEPTPSFPKAAWSSKLPLGLFSISVSYSLESRVSWVRIPPEAANFSLEKVFLR